MIYCACSQKKNLELEVFQMSRESKYDLIDDLLRKKEVINVQDAEKLGVSRRLLSKWAAAGRLQRVAQGLYQSATAVPDDLAILVAASGCVAVSHESALYLLNLTSRCPAMYSATFPKGTNPPKAFSATLKKYYVIPELFDIGLSTVRTPSGAVVPCYNAERTVCDILRSRSRIDSETLYDALRRYSASNAKDMNRLSKYAQIFHLEKILPVYMGALL